jgi:hypothetical protein
MPFLSIIIVHHHTPRDVTNCLFSLQQGFLPPDTEIIVVNNGGHQSNKQIDPTACQNLPIKFLDIPNHGFPQANNFALSKTQAKYYAFINPDIVVEPDTIKKLLDYLRTNTQVGIVAPQLRYPDCAIQDNYRVFPNFMDLVIKRTPLLRKKFQNRMRQYLMWDKDPHKNEAVDWVTGAFTMMTHHCLQKIGKKHDDRFFLFMSDVVICRNAWEKGWEVHFVGETRALHNDKRLSSGGILDIFRKKTLRIHIEDAAKYYLRYFGKPLPSNCPSLAIRTKELLAD